MFKTNLMEHLKSVNNISSYLNIKFVSTNNLIVIQFSAKIYRGNLTTNLKITKNLVFAATVQLSNAMCFLVNVSLFKQ